ncbi:Transcriptional regulatory protein TcrA [compost metagenome]
MRILYIEDNELLAKSTTRSLTRAGFTVDAFGDAEDAWAAWKLAVHEAVILDLMLGDEHGLDLLGRARGAGLRAPVIVLTALGEIDERIRGLNQGADDYMVKPFSVDELIARIRAVGRRPGQSSDPVLTLGPLRYDPAGQTLSGPAAEMTLSRAEGLVIERFFRRPDRVISKEQLGEALHPLEGGYSENSLHILVHRARRRLAAVGGGVAVKALRGLGYVATAVS